MSTTPMTSPTTSTDEHAGLRRQALLIALLAAAGDGVLFVLAVGSLPATAAAPAALLWGVGAVVVAADLLLALPARTAGWVAVVHGVVRCATAVLLWQLTGDRDLGTGNSAGLAVAGYRAGAWAVGWRSWTALAALALGMTGAQAVELTGGSVGAGAASGAAAAAAVTTVANTVLPWLMGRYTTGRAGHIEQVERAADERRRAAVAEVERARTAERGAIARDLHDTISHHVSAIGVHAAAGRLALAAADGAGAEERRPALVSLQHVEGASSAAMADLRRMLGLLARGSDDGARQPGLADVDALLEGSRRAGLRVDVETPGLDPARLPGSTQLAAYRIVQEVLTNAHRHGDGTLHLVLRQSDTALTVLASNPVAAGERRSADGSGRGLAGMAHRAQLFGGTATAGPADDARTWCTRVDLPVVGP